MQVWVVVGIALVYIGLLFAVASYGDRARPSGGRAWIYALSLGVYCTSWTFLGSVGLASRSGLDFLAIYVGPILMIGICWPLVARVVRLAKAQNITSIADFIAARYGKSQAVAAAVSLIALVGAVPYIALQLKAVSVSLTTLVGAGGAVAPLDIALLVALAMAAFAVLFGTRYADATEHQEGLILAIAAESVVKLVAFLVVGLFVVFGIFGGPQDLWTRAAAAGVGERVVQPAGGSTFLAMVLLSFVCALLLPRQFHVTVVESGGVGDVRRAAWLFPAYLVLINLFVVPIALAGLTVFPPGQVDPDTFVLALPMAAEAWPITLAAFVGGLSAATAMVIVETVALSIMISNGILMPLVLRFRRASGADRADMGRRVLNLRRLSILATLLLAYGYYRVTGTAAALAEIGLLSFAAIAQFAPAFFGGLVWRDATASGALAGMLTGFAVWAYTMLLPTFAAAGLVPEAIVSEGLFGLAWLRPEALFGTELEPLPHAVFWSLSLNLLAYVAVGAARGPRPIERVQAGLFLAPDRMPLGPALRLRRTSVTVEELKLTLARYLGEERTALAFAQYAEGRPGPLRLGQEADVDLLQRTERLLASAIGAASSRVVLSLLLTRRNVSREAALRLLDDASAALQYNRDLLQTALDHVRQGIAVFDEGLRLICWNRQFRDLLELPDEAAQVGTPLADVIRFMAERGDLGPGSIESRVAARLDQVVVRLETFQERLVPSGTVLEVRTARLPHGGLVATYTDITEKVTAAEALELANETLERRVRERTDELMRLNAELARAKAAADEANISKTRFLAAASHDILQPLNAARLYASTLSEGAEHGAPGLAPIARNIDSSLEAVEDILSALLDISRLDAGALKPELSSFRLDELFRQLKVEFEPMARAKGLRLDVVATSLAVRSDRQLLRRLLQNLLSNAVKYTGSGRVLLGCRRRGSRLRIEVHDTGPGIPPAKHRLVFREFQRLEEGARAAHGLGLGLSIVERIGRVLQHRVDLVSSPGRGALFAVEVPVSAELPRASDDRRRREPVSVRLDGLQVLCVDNEPKILDGMAALLSGWGCTVRAAPGEAEAAAALDGGFVPDVLLIDYHLDRGTGLEAAAALRRRLGRDVPAVLITADRSPEVRSSARERGMPLLNKPLKPAALRALLAGWRVRGAAAAE